MRKVNIIIQQVTPPLAQDDKNFTEAPPFLFGSEFAKKSKEYRISSK